MPITATKGPALVANPRMEHSAVCIAKGLDHKETVLKALEGCGGLQSLVRAGSTVLIKPNLVGPSPSGAGRITDWRVVQTLVDECNRLGARKVLVVECPVEGSWDKDLLTAGYMGMENACLVNPNIDVGGCIYAIPEKSISGTGYYLPKEYLEADVVISAPIMKTHYTAGVTISLKNIGIGIPPLSVYGKDGSKTKLHEIGINRVIPDICSIRPPDFTIVDGIMAGEGMGPTNPTPVRMGVVVAGRDPVAVDATCARLMGIDPREITHIVYASEVGLGHMDPEPGDLVGENPMELRRYFKRPPNRGYPIKRTTVVRTLPQGCGSASPEYILQSGRPEGIWGPQGPLCRFSLLHDRDNVYLAVAPEVPIERVDLLLSFDMPFEEDVRSGRHARFEGKDYIISACLGGRNGGTLKCREADVQGSTLLPSPEGGWVIAMPLWALGKEPLTPRQELWLDVGVKPKDMFTSILWSGAIHLGQYTDPTSAGRAFIAPW